MRNPWPYAWLGPYLSFNNNNQFLYLVLLFSFSELYKLLDEKDEEIHVVTRLNEQLKGQFSFFFLYLTR